MLLWDVEHGREQVRAEHRGQVYIEYRRLHIAHSGRGGLASECAGSVDGRISAIGYNRTLVGGGLEENSIT